LKNTRNAFNYLRFAKWGSIYLWGNGTYSTHLLFGDIDGLINYNPDGALPAARMRRGALVGDVVIRVWQQRPHGYVSNGRGEACGWDGFGRGVHKVLSSRWVAPAIYAHIAQKIWKHVCRGLMNNSGHHPVPSS